MIEIRKYKKSDWNRLCEIHDEGRMLELEGSVDLKAFKTLEQTAESEGLFEDNLYVATDNKKVVGFIAFNSEEINWLYTDPKLFRKGIGKTLVEFALQFCGDIVTLDVLSENHMALSFYEKMGFVKKKLVKGHLEGNESFPAAGWLMEYKKK